MPYAHQVNAPTSSADETSTELNHIQIADIVLPEGAKPLLQRKMRLRQLDVTPGGVVPIHSHENRPAILYILKGSMHEYNSRFENPRFFKEGDTLAEFNHVTHWAKNASDTEILSILTFDLLDDGTPFEVACKSC
jgi:quercetin dioxygenase-like cupin family protein